MDRNKNIEPRQARKAYALKAMTALLLSFMLLLSGCAAIPGAVSAPEISEATAAPEATAPESTLTQTPVPETAKPSAAVAQTPAPAAVPVSYSKYTAEVDADPDNARVEVRVSLDYVNDTPDDLYELTLRLWPNAVYAGCLELTSVTQEDADCYYTLSASGTAGESVLVIPINRDFHPGDKVSIGLQYTIKVPEMDGRFGVNELGMNLGNILPTIAIYENGAWRIDEYVATGDSFFSKAADYKVLIRCPQKYAVAASGTAGDAQYLDDKGLYECVYTAEPARDFAITLVGEAFTEIRSSESGVRVLAYSKQKSRSAFLADTAASALSYYETKLGAYPYGDLCAVGTAITGGMEYPGLILVDYEGLDGSEKPITELFIAHEIAHQWFYNLVGTDQQREPWVDEALVEYLSFDYIRSVYGQDYMKKLWSSRFHDIAGYNITLPLDASLSDYAKAPAGDYVYGVYARGSAFYDELYTKLGEEKFYGALKELISAKRFGTITGTELLAAFSDISGENITALFDAYKASQPSAAESSVTW